MTLPPQPWFVLCVPCLDGRHEACDPIPFCSCFVEVLLEAELIPDDWGVE